MENGKYKIVAFLLAVTLSINLFTVDVYAFYADKYLPANWSGMNVSSKLNFFINAGKDKGQILNMEILRSDYVHSYWDLLTVLACESFGVKLEDNSELKNYLRDNLPSYSGNDFIGYLKQHITVGSANIKLDATISSDIYSVLYGYLVNNKACIYQFISSYDDLLEHEFGDVKQYETLSNVCASLKDNQLLYYTAYNGRVSGNKRDKGIVYRVFDYESAVDGGQVLGQSTANFYLYGVPRKYTDGEFYFISDSGIRYSEFTGYSALRGDLRFRPFVFDKKYPSYLDGKVFANQNIPIIVYRSVEDMNKGIANDDFYYVTERWFEYDPGSAITISQYDIDYTLSFKSIDSAVTSFYNDSYPQDESISGERIMRIINALSPESNLPSEPGGSNIPSDPDETQPNVLKFIEPLLYVFDWMRINKITLFGFTFTFMDVFVWTLFASIGIGFINKIRE